MSYTVKVTQKTKDLQDLSFRTYDIFDAAGKLAGHAVRRGKDVVFQLIGGPTVKRQASNVERAINNWAENRAKLGEGDVILHPRYKAQKERLERQIADFIKLSSADVDEDKLKRLAAFWWNNDESPAVEKLLARLGWEIGRDEAWDDEPGAFVVRTGDEDGHSFINWSPDQLRNTVSEGDVVKHKFGLKQQQKNKTRYRFYQEIKDDIPVYDRGTHNAVLPKYIETHKHPENLEPFDHFAVEPSVSGVNGRMLGITNDGMKVFFAASRLETAKALVDAYNRGGFSDLDIEKVPLEPTESRRPSAALAGIALVENPAYANMTPAEREAYKAKQRENQQRRLDNMTPAEREAYKAKQREANRASMAKKRANMTPSEREEHWTKERERFRNRYANMTPAEREVHLAKQQEYAEQRFQRYAQDPTFDPSTLSTNQLKLYIKFLEKEGILAANKEKEDNYQLDFNLESAALKGIAEAERELSPWNFKKRSEQEIALRKAKGTEKYNQQRLERTKDTRSTFDEIEDRVLEIVGQDAYTSKDPHDVERVENVRLAVKRTLKRSDPNIDREGRALSKLERSVEVRRKGSTGYKDF